MRIITVLCLCFLFSCNNSETERKLVQAEARIRKLEAQAEVHIGQLETQVEAAQTKNIDPVHGRIINTLIKIETYQCVYLVFEDGHEEKASKWRARRVEKKQAKQKAGPPLQRHYTAADERMKRRYGE